MFLDLFLFELLNFRQGFLLTKMMFRRSASAVLVKELQAKIDKGDNVEFETQVDYFSFLSTFL